MERPARKVALGSVCTLGAVLAAGVGALSLSRGLGRARAERLWRSNRPTRVAELGTTSFLSILPLVEAAAASDDLATEPGVSYLIETEGSRILFDVGLNLRREDPSPLQHNMARLGLTTDDFDTVVISHNHPDHVGGLEWSRHKTFALGTSQAPLEGKRVITPVQMTYPGLEPVAAPEPMALAPGVATTGTIPRQLFMGWVEEQALVVNVSGHGLVLVVGCGHQTLPKLLERVAEVFEPPLWGVVGGLHYPVPHGRGRLLGIDVQRLLASGNGPLHPVTEAEVHAHLDALAALEPGLVALSPHDSSDEAISWVRERFGKASRALLVGERITVGTRGDE
jgi:7,8-dihydropterin-6-yl-methyl-4-(beta-D-ribofuranosyl)aminobenzene 5'-phosphate synthase